MREKPEEHSIGGERKEKKRRKRKKPEKQDIPRVTTDTMDRIRYELTEGKDLGTDVVRESMERTVGEDPVKEGMGRR